MADVELGPPVIATLLAQHEELRTLADECERLCDRLGEELDEDGTLAGRLAQGVGRLRIAFDAHRQEEERVLRSLIMGAPVGSGSVEERTAAHIREHRHFGSSLERGGGAAGGLREVLQALRQHLDEEDRYFAVLDCLSDA